MRRLLLWVLAGLLLLAIGVAWFLIHYEEVTVTRPGTPGVEARQNRYLALERFFARMGRPLERRSDVRFLDDLPPGGVLILDSGRRTHLTPERQKRLWAWVEEGGYLIVSPDFPADDPLMAHLDLSRFSRQKQSASGEKAADVPEQAEASDEEEAGAAEESADNAEAVPGAPADDAPACPAAKAGGGKKDDRVRLQIPGAAHPLLAELAYRGLQTGKVKPVWQAGGSGHGSQYVHFSPGRGQVTVVASLAGQFSNVRIGNEDHAEIIWTLVQTYQPHRTGPLSLMTRLEMPTLRQWLLEHAVQALLAGAVFLLLWLWRVVPRFGLPQPDPEPDRRQLRDHLTAVGRYIWRSGGLPHWLAVGREAFQMRLALRHPALACLPPQEQAEALARLTQRPVGLIAAALHGPADSVSSFTSAMRTLRNIERSL